MAKKPETSSMMTDDESPIGALPSGGINIVNKDDPPFRPTVIDADGNVVDLDDDDEAGE